MLNRRGVLAGAIRLSATSLFASATRRLQAKSLPASQPTHSSAPAHLQTLSSGKLSVQFDSARGVPFQYTYSGATLRGDQSAAPLKAILCQLRPRAYYTVSAVVDPPHISGETAAFPIRLNYGKLPGASATLVYRVTGSSVAVSLASVVEHPGFELIELTLPRLLSALQSDPSAWMAQGRGGGSWVHLSHAKAFQFAEEDYFGRISTQTPVAMLGSASIGCSMEVQSFMDGTLSELANTPAGLEARLGTIQTFRVHGGRCYNMNDGGDAVCGNSTTPNLLVEQTPQTRLDFFSTASSAAQPWLPGALILQARAPQSPTQYYSDKLVYIIGGRVKTEPAPRTTFAQSHALVHDVSLLTDQAPQVAFLGGWDYDGQDTGFPSEDKVNASLGTSAELIKLIAEAPAWNANITLNVNYDDAYKSSPIFNPDFIARRPDGKIWKSRAWDGEDSYITGMAKFMQGGWGNRRIEYTVDHYKIHDALLIDALSWFAIRNDWDPAHPASGYVNLVKGKIPLLNKAKSLGINIASEVYRYPLLGTLGLTMNGPVQEPCPFGGEPIPLAAILYRKSAIWGNAGESTFDPSTDLFWNNRPSIWFRASSDRSTIAELYFLVSLPYSKLHQLAVTDYKASGTSRTLVLADNSHIERDTNSRAYSAVFNGIPIAANDATFCPIDDHRIAFYSRSAATLHYPLPPHWDATAVTARSLHLSGSQSFPVRVAASHIVVDAPSRIPIIVYREPSHTVTSRSSSHG